jgi:hypothetical protein
LGLIQIRAIAIAMNFSVSGEIATSISGIADLGYFLFLDQKEYVNFSHSILMTAVS